MSDLGADLRVARERAGLSLSGLSARTKIREPLLDAIEHDDFSHVPSGLLARGYLRAYAHEVGLEPESIIRRYVHEIEPPEPPLVLPSAQADRFLGRSDHPHQWFVAAVLVGIAGIFFYVSNHPHARGTSALLSLASIGGFNTGTGSLAQDPAAADLDGRAPVDQGPLKLDITPSSVVWVQATADGRRVLYSLVYPGQVTTIEARQELVLRVGDTGAFRYSLNGLRGRSLGTPGQVREVVITRANRTDFQDRSR